MIRSIDSVSVGGEVLRMIRQRIGIQGLWSLCELRVDERDLQGLRRWARSLNPNEILLDDQVLAVEGQKVPRCALFGLVFLLYASEIARREAVEGQIWPVLQSDHFRPETKAQLFEGGQPVPALRHAVERACLHFNLRNVFGTAGVQQWLDSVYLQFGFTRKGVNRLAWWLGGQNCPQAIERLLSGPLSSESFQRLWRAMLELRANRGVRDRVARLVQESPWVLSSWTDEVVTQALKGTARSSGRVEATFFAAPRFCWAEAVPHFSFGIGAVELLHLDQPTYEIHMGGVKYTRLLLQANGRYQPVREITVELGLAEVELSLFSTTGVELIRETFELFDTSEDITVYRLRDGSRVENPWDEPLSSSSEHALLLPDDLEILPDGPRQWVAAGTGWRVYRIAAGAAVEVWLAGELMWSPCTLKAEPAWAREIQMTWMRCGDDIKVEMWHPDDVVISNVRANRQSPALLPRDAASTLTEPVRVRGPFFTRRLECSMRAVRGTETLRLRRSAALELIPFLRREGSEVVEIARQGATFAEALDDVRILAPSCWGGAAVTDWCLMEGDRWVDRPSRRWGALTGLSGWGWPLTLRTRPYNSAEPDLVLLDEVCSRGVLADVGLEDGRLRLHLARPIEVGRAHAVLVWHRDGTWVEERPSSAWTVPCYGPPVAVGIVYEGTRVGAWWSDDWSEHVEALGRSDPAEAVWLLRLLRLPVMATRHARRVARWAREHATDFLDEWTAPDADEATSAVVRAMFDRWQPSVVVAREISRRLADGRPAWQGALRLTRVDPLLAARVSVASSHPLSDTCAALSASRSIEEARVEAERLRVRTAQAMGVSEVYLSRLVKVLVDGSMTWSPGEARDSRLALTVEPFRRLIALSYLLATERSAAL